VSRIYTIPHIFLSFFEQVGLMNYSSLEDAYGTPFGTRVPVTHDRKDATPAAPPMRENQAEKHAEIIADVSKSLSLDTDKNTENFAVQAPAVVQHIRPQEHQRMAVREHFGTPPAGSADDKLARILRLIEQNKTGYETSSTQDVLLYVVTGVIFLFTFDTFVMLGKTMGGRRN
jgi:hypothetical protein